MKYDVACQALAEAMRIDEVKDIADKATALKEYARQAKNRQLEIDAGEIRIRAERRLGELLKGMEKNKGAAGIGTSAVPQENRTPTLSSMGVDKKLSARAQKVADIPEEEFEEIVGEWRDTLQEANERVTTNILEAADKVHNHRAQGTGENEWYTPARYVEMAREVMGGINLDPASSEIANNIVGRELISLCRRLDIIE